MRLLVFFLVATLCLSLDLLSKEFVSKIITPREVIEVVPNFFNIILTYNKGIAFGLFSNSPELIRVLVVIVASFLALIFLIYIYFKSYRHSYLALIAVAMIFGGALGNLYERVVYSKVTDFLDVYYQTWHWPAFNLADSFICIAVFLLFFVKEKK